MAKKQIDTLVRFAINTEASEKLVTGFDLKLMEVNLDRALNNKPSITRGMLAKNMAAAFLKDPKAYLEFVNFDK